MRSVQTAPAPIPSAVADPLTLDPPPFGPLPQFLQSSQARHWMRSEPQLAEARRDANARARDEIERAAREIREEPLEPLSVDDELAIIRYYLLRIGRFVRAVKLPPLVEATAMTFMKRFYLRNSCMHFHPKSIMYVGLRGSHGADPRLTSIYLAAKAENYPISLARFCAQVNELAGASRQGQGPSAPRSDVNEREICALEFGMVQTLEFELAVHGAHRALYGLILDMQTLDPTLSRDELMAFAAGVQPLLHLSRVSDAEFVFAPTHIALACCWMCVVPPSGGTASKSIVGRELVQRWLDAKEQRARPLREKQRAEREAWRAKKRGVLDARAEAERRRAAKGGKHAKEEPESNGADAESNGAAAPEELAESELAAMPLGVPRAEIEQLLERAAALIRSAAGDERLRPREDVDRVKQVDLRLKACLALDERVRSAGYVPRERSEADSSTRKRTAEGDGADSKRARLADDSDDDL